MSTKYPANIFSAIVAELSGMFYPGNTAAFPTESQLGDDFINGKKPFESVNDYLRKSQSDSSMNFLTEQDELNVIREMLAQGFLVESSGIDVISQRNKMNISELEKIDNWKQIAYSESLKNFRISYEAVNILGEVISLNCTLKAISEFDAAMLFGEENSGENYLIKEVKEV